MYNMLVQICDILSHLLFIVLGVQVASVNWLYTLSGRKVIISNVLVSLSLSLSVNINAVLWTRENAVFASCDVYAYFLYIVYVYCIFLAL